MACQISAYFIFPKILLWVSSLLSFLFSVSICAFNFILSSLLHSLDSVSSLKVNITGCFQPFLFLTKCTALPASLNVWCVLQGFVVIQCFFLVSPLSFDFDLLMVASLSLSLLCRTLWSNLERPSSLYSYERIFMFPSSSFMLLCCNSSSVFNHFEALQYMLCGGDSAFFPDGSLIVSLQFIE